MKLKRNSRKRLVVIVIGSSGAGKSTFINAMKIPNNHKFITSQPMVDYLRKRSREINHDTIFALSEKWYAENSFWMVDLMEKKLGRKKYLIIDGTRRMIDIKILKKLFRVIIVQIYASPKIRFQRLQERNKISLQTYEEFKRLEKDENEKMDIKELVKEANIAIKNNNHDIEKIRKEGRIFSYFIKRFI